MNKITSTIKSRTTIRKWKANPISKDTIKDIVDCGFAGPKAYDVDSIEIITVDQPKVIDKLLDDRYQLIDHPHYINSEKFAKINGLSKYEEVSKPPLVIVVGGNQKLCQDIPSLLQTMSCAAQNILLAAESYQLGACWLYVYDEQLPQTEKNVKKLLKIPNHIRVNCLIAIGEPATSTTSKKVVHIKYRNNAW